MDDEAVLASPPASAQETRSIEAMSRKGVVDAYSAWTAVSDAEQRCIDIVFRDGSRTLDLGCGAGRFAMHLGNRCASYLGVDASSEMIAAARRNCPNLSFVVSDILKVSVEPETVDVILLMGNVLDCLHPIERRSRMLAQCATWLRAGGTIVGSSHLTRPGQSKGYYSEDYHGATLLTFRATLAEHIEEAETFGLEVVLASRDYRDGPEAHWCYWAAKLVSRC